jgi:hypothetical protein
MKRVADDKSGFRFELVPMDNLDSGNIPLSVLKDAPTQVGRHFFPNSAYLSRDAIRCYTEEDVAHVVVVSLLLRYFHVVAFLTLQKSKNPVRVVSKDSGSTVHYMNECFEMRENDVLELAFDEATNTGYLPLALQQVRRWKARWFVVCQLIYW